MSKSTTTNPLVEHALKNVWAAPDPMRQATYGIGKMSQPGGEWQKFELDWGDQYLPNQDDRFHVYALGHYHNTLSVLSQDYREKWFNVTDAGVETSTVIDIYNADGIMIPRHLCYFYISVDGSILMAIKLPEPGILQGLDIEEDALFVRFYTNLYLNKGDSVLNGKNPIRSGGQRVASRQEIVALQQIITAVSNEYPIGEFTFSVNGRYVDVVNTVSVKEGDYVDWLYCATVTDVIDFKVSALGTFMSERDGERKYLISHNEDVNYIQYHDDIMVFIVFKEPRQTTGVLLHKNAPSTLRMITHRDYALSERVLKAVMANNGIDEQQAYIRFVYHNTGVKRPLVFEANRIHDLYRLPFAKRQQIMLGSIEAPEFWNASKLEDNSYIDIMSAKSGTVDLKMVEGGYGYNAMSTVLGYTPSKVVKRYGKACVDIPIGLRGVCTGYEYNAQGLLTGVSTNRGSSVHWCLNQDTVWVELIFGEGDTGMDYITNVVSGFYDSTYNYRFYKKDNGKWSDITGTGAIKASNGKWTLTNPADASKVLVLSNAKHLFNSAQVEVQGGLVEFDIMVRVDRTDILFEIPPMHVDITLNQHPLVEGVDYFVNWPKVVITSKEFFNGNADDIQYVNWRCTGFCNKETMKHTPPTEVGIVINGKLSSNSRYDLHDDRILSIVADGAMYDRSEVKFAETSSGVAIKDSREGAPYAIKDIFVPMNNYLTTAAEPDDSTYETRKKSLAIDKVVTDFMTVNYPQTQLGIAQLGSKSYAIYSPFFSRVIFDLANGYINDPAIEGGNVSESTVRRIVDQYLYLLDVDPVQEALPVVQECVRIDPVCENKVFKLTPAEADFLDVVVRLYGNGLINVNGFITTRA